MPHGLSCQPLPAIGTLNPTKSMALPTLWSSTELSFSARSQNSEAPTVSLN